MRNFKKEFKGIDRSKLAKTLGSSRNTIYQVICGALRVSPQRAMAIEQATDGKIPAAILRPDIFSPKKRKRKAA